MQKSQENDSLANAFQGQQDKHSSTFSVKQFVKRSYLFVSILCVSLLGFFSLFNSSFLKNFSSSDQDLSVSPSPTIVTSTQDSCFQATKWYFINEALQNPAIVCSLHLVANEDLPRMAASSVSFTRLQSLHLEEMNATMPSEIGNITTLDTINFHLTFYTSLPSEIGKLKNLRNLFFQRADVKELPAEIGELKQLRSLGIVRNTDKIVIPDEIERLTELRSLVLSRNPGLTLPSTLIRNQKLETVDLSANNLENVPSSIYQLKNIKTLLLQSNKIVNISPQIANLTFLETLRLDNNQLTSIPSLGSMLNLKSLSLANNNLTALPEGLESLQQLGYLNVSGNKIPENTIETLKTLLPKAQIVY